MTPPVDKQTSLRAAHCGVLDSSVLLLALSIITLSRELLPILPALLSNWWNKSHIQMTPPVDKQTSLRAAHCGVLDSSVLLPFLSSRSLQSYFHFYMSAFLTKIVFD